MKKILSILLLVMLLFTKSQPVLATLRQTPTGFTFEQMQQQIEAIMDEHVGTATPGAAVVVVYEGEIVFSRGYGYANRENQIPVNPQTTVFEYASISKPFVWVAVMQLVEQGLLSLDTDINTYLPSDFVFAKPFTMRDLLNHTAGFEDVLLGVILDAANQAQSNQSLRASLLASQPRQIFTPSTVSAYSNWGSALAAFVVEYVSGVDYATFERNQILLTADLQNTLNQPDWLGNDAFLANKANGYTADGDGNFTQAMWSYLPMFPSGALNGTAQDLAKFIKALTPPAGEAGIFFENPETLATLFTSSSLDPLNRPGMYHGFMSWNSERGPAFGHGGALIGFNTEFVFVPEARFGYVILTNSAGGSVIFPEIQELLLGNQQSTPVPITNDLPSATVVEGRFILARRIESSFLKLIPYLLSPMLQVTAVDDTTILLSANSFWQPNYNISAKYRQIAPYLFQIEPQAESSILSQFLSVIRFNVEDDIPTQINVGNGADFTALPPGKTMPLLILSLITVLASVVFLLLAPIIFAILFIIRWQKKQKLEQFVNVRKGALLLGMGFLLVANNLLLILRMIVENFRLVAEMAPHIWFNYFLAILAVLLFFSQIWTWKKVGAVAKWQKLLLVLTFGFVVLLMLNLHHWRFFALL